MTAEIIDFERYRRGELANANAKVCETEALTVSERTRVHQFVMSFDGQPSALEAALILISRLQGCSKESVQ